MMSIALGALAMIIIAVLLSLVLFRNTIKVHMEDDEKCASSTAAALRTESEKAELNEVERRVFAKADMVQKMAKEHTKVAYPSVADSMSVPMLSPAPSAETPPEALPSIDENLLVESVEAAEGHKDVLNESAVLKAISEKVEVIRKLSKRG